MKTVLTVATVMAAVKDGAASLSDIWHGIGGKGNISGSTGKKIRELVPNINLMLVNNKADKAKGLKPRKGSSISRHDEVILRALAKSPRVQPKPLSPVDQDKITALESIHDGGKVTPPQPKEKIPMEEKEKAMEQYRLTGTPFKPGSLMAIVFEHGAKKFRPLGEILTDAANDPRFIAKYPDLPLGDSGSGRYQIAQWKESTIRGKHPNNHGVTDVIPHKDETRRKGHGRIVKMVFLAA